MAQKYAEELFDCFKKENMNLVAKWFLSHDVLQNIEIYRGYQSNSNFCSRKNRDLSEKN